MLRIPWEYLDLIICLEMPVHIFVHFHHERNFALYIEVLEKLTQWLFVLDHQNYDHWVPVPVQNMVYSWWHERWASAILSLPQDTKEVFCFATGPSTWTEQCKGKLLWWCNMADGELSSIEKMDGIRSRAGKATGRVWKAVFYRWLMIFETKNRGFQLCNPSIHKSINSAPQLHGWATLLQQEPCELMILDTHDYVDKDVDEQICSMEARGTTKYTIK